MEEMPFEFNVKSTIEIVVLVTDCEGNTSKIKFILVQEISYFNLIS